MHGAPHSYPRSTGCCTPRRGSAASHSATFPAAVIVLAITWLLYIGVRESARANNIWGRQAWCDDLGVLGAMHIDTANTIRRAERLARHPPGSATVLRLIGFDAIRRRERQDPATHMAHRDPDVLQSCTIIYVIVVAVAPPRAVHALKAADPLARCARSPVSSRPPAASSRSARSCRDGRAARLSVRPSPYLLSRWRATGLLPSGRRVHPVRTPDITTVVTVVVVALGRW